MIIQHNIAAVNAYRNLSVNKDNLSKNLEKLSSGYRINRSADDAAGLAISEQMRSKINGLDQATANAKDAIGLIQTTEGALTETHSMLQRMKTLATQAANGTYNDEARSAIGKEVAALSEEIDRIASTTDYNGIKPIASGASKMQMQVGPTSGETLDIPGADMGVSALSIKSLAVSSVSAANGSITKIETAINKVSEHRASLGAAQNRLEHTINNLKTTSENMTAAEARIRDTDMAKEIASYTKNNILNQAAQAMLAQANQQPQGVLSLLQ
ncbi:flagellin [Oribacterium sp. oral taxon 102]|uniref:flagellin N-terminal helical domain-containing protein n=1 Tax=Oribacterium sp. oral taxon 102 TaxID=671214 RepID=UPI0015BE0E24|nr:flagellin [Oribacterium sp. oral taxon 102]NWO21755.1 flagellin [Oribacterium sp. oral taxon 102]